MNQRTPTPREQRIGELGGLWICPACRTKLALRGHLCRWCKGRERDAQDERALQSQLRHGG